MRYFVYVFALLTLGTVSCDTFAEATPVPVKKLPFTVSKETTYLTGPLNLDGTVNYVKAINDKYSKGITPENNAAVLLVQVFGPSYMDDTIRDRTLKMLGIDKLPEKGDYFISYGAYCEKHAKGVSNEEREKQYDRAMHAPWKEKDCPLVAGWIKANEKPMKLIIQATKRPKFWIPMLSPKEPPPLILDTFLPAFGRSRSAGNLLAAHAMLKIDSGQPEIAFDYLKSIYQLASYFREGPTIVHYLVGLVIHDFGNSLARHMALSGHLKRTQLIKLLKICQIAKPFDQPIKLFNYERFALLDICAAIIRHPSSSFSPVSLNTAVFQSYHRFIDWDVIFKNHNQLYDQLIKAAKIPEYKQRRQAFEELKKIVYDIKVNWTIKQFIDLSHKLRVAKTADKSLRKKATDMANRYLRFKLDSISVFPTSSKLNDRSVTEDQITRIAIALSIYKLDHGQFPKQLSALSPKYLKVIPTDMFSGKPFIYRLTDKGFILYSVMTNGKDDGGINDDETDKDDLLVAEYPVKVE